MYNNILFISMPGPGEWMLILLVVLILFGGKKIPQLAKDLGTGIREFKKSLSSTAEDAEINTTKLDAPAQKSPRKKTAKKS